MNVRSLLGPFLFIFVGMFSMILYSWGISWFEGVPFLLIFVPLYFACLETLFSFRECSQAHCFARGSVLEYPEAVRACAMCRYPWNLGTFLSSYCFLSFFRL